MTDYLLDRFYNPLHRRWVLRLWQGVLITFFMWIAMLVILPQIAYGTSNNAISSCAQHLPQKDSQYQGRIIQQQLSSLYHDNIDFQTAFKTKGTRLTDGIFGPVTHQWLVTFCQDFAVATLYNADNTSKKSFITTTLSALDRASNLNAIFPNWRDAVPTFQLLTLSSQELMQLLAPKPETNINESTEIDESVNAMSVESYYYQLTTEDLNRQQTLVALQTLGKQQFPERSELYNELVKLINELDANLNPALDLAKYVQAKSLTHSSESNSETQATSNTTSTTANKASSNTSDKGSDTDENNQSNNAAADSNVTQTSTTSKTKITAPLVHWQLDSTSLFAELEKQQVFAVSASLKKQVEPLAGKVFSSQYLFESALVLQGIDIDSPDAVKAIKTAKKTGVTFNKASPINWQAPKGCGCQDSQISIFGDATFYGFFPYWIEDESPQLINFSQLDRIGLFGAVAKPSSNGSSLQLPPNWQSTQEYSQFVKTAHRYRSQVDLVVTTPRDLNAMSLVELLDNKLIEQMVEAIAQPLDLSLVNRMKPIMTLGLTPIPTLGDGITLDVDLSSLNTSVSQQAFINFVRRLKLALLKLDGKSVSSSEEIVAKPNDRFFLNIIIPIDEVLADNPDSFYTFSNLEQLSKLSNHLIMRPNATHVPDQASTSTKAEQLRHQLQDLHRWLSNQREQLNVKQIVKKMVPMLVTPSIRNSEVELNQLLHLSSWSFRSAAYYPVPLNDLSRKLVNETFYPQLDSQLPAFAALELGVSALINWVCPNRWELRAVLFVVFIAIVSLVIVSNWYYTLRKYLIQTPFVLLCVSSLAMLMLVFIADPHFSQFRVAILLGFMAVIVGILLMVRWLTTEGDKP